MQSGMLFNLVNTAPREEYLDSVWGETMSTLTPASSGKACNKTLIKTLVFMMLPFAGSGIDIYSPSLPYIQHYFSTTATFVQLMISLYLLGLCLGQLVLGGLSDAFGRIDPLLAMQDNNYGNYAEIAHLIINHVEVKNVSTTFTDFSALCNWMQAVTPHCSQLPVTDC